MQPGVSRELHDRTDALPQIVRDIAWKAQIRLLRSFLRRLAPEGEVPYVLAIDRTHDPRRRRQALTSPFPAELGHTVRRQCDCEG